MSRKKSRNGVSIFQQIDTLTGHTGQITTLCGHPSSPQRSLIITGSEDSTIRIWDYSTGKEIQRLRGHPSGVLSVDYSPSGFLFASGGKDSKFHIWSEGFTQPFITKEFIGYNITQVKFDFKEDWIGVALSPKKFSPDNPQTSICVFLMKVKNPKTTFQIEGKGSKDQCFFFNSTGSGIFYNRGSTIFHRDFVRGRDKEILTIPSGDLKKWSINARGTVVGIVYQSAPTILYYIDITQSKVVPQQVYRFDDLITCLTVSSDGKYIGVGTERSGACFWNVEEKKDAFRLSYKISGISALSFFEGGNSVLISTLDGSFMYYNLNHAFSGKTFASCSTMVTAIAYNPVYDQLIAGLSSGYVAIWNTKTREYQRFFGGRYSELSSIAIHPKGSRVVTGSMDGRLTIWDIFEEKKIFGVRFAVEPVLSVTYNSIGDIIYFITPSALYQFSVENEELNEIPISTDKLKDIHFLRYIPETESVIIGSSIGNLLYLSPRGSQRPEYVHHLALGIIDALDYCASSATLVYLKRLGSMYQPKFYEFSVGVSKSLEPFMTGMLDTKNISISPDRKYLVNETSQGEIAFYQLLDPTKAISSDFVPKIPINGSLAQMIWLSATELITVDATNEIMHIDVKYLFEKSNK